MNNKLKLLFVFLMSLALMFGFLHLFVPSTEYNFERLHIFLFNLCSGGTILIYFTEQKKELSVKAIVFLSLAIFYAVFAFLHYYIPAMIISLILSGIVESVRIKRFSFFPIGFFKKEEPVHSKFHQASLLCLSMGLIISCGVILNNEYIKLITMSKLKLDIFFLGFSFPISLITMSVIFALMNGNQTSVKSTLKEMGFWNVNLGVVFFFLFILFEKLVPQVLITFILFFTVSMIFFLYQHLGSPLQQKNFLTSGMAFLLVTAVTGILYILFEFSPEYNSENYKWLLKLHAFASLYGWNLCGLAVIIRYDDFPIQLHSRYIILLHWVTAILLAPLGYYFPVFAVLAIVAYTTILCGIFFARKRS